MTNLKIDTSSCLKPCSGLIVTSFSKSKLENDLETLFPIIREYNFYKRVTTYPYVTEYIHEWKNKLRLVRIYFDTPTFDIITKDRAAKFVDMLSAIGGTMGLLTGFSIISAAEILYFAAKIGWNITQKNMSKNKNFK